MIFEKELSCEFCKLDKSLSKPILQGISKSSLHTKKTRTREGSKTNKDKNGEKDEKNGFLEQCSISPSPCLRSSIIINTMLVNVY